MYTFFKNAANINDKCGYYEFLFAHLKLHRMDDLNSGTGRKDVDEELKNSKKPYYPCNKYSNSK